MTNDQKVKKNKVQKLYEAIEQEKMKVRTNWKYGENIWDNYTYLGS